MTAEQFERLEVVCPCGTTTVAWLEFRSFLTHTYSKHLRTAHTVGIRWELIAFCDARSGTAERILLWARHEFGATSFEPSVCSTFRVPISFPSTTLFSMAQVSILHHRKLYL